MKLNEIVSFSKESFFNGAVQTEWFYDDEKSAAIAESYVFHGPKYYGVSSADVSLGSHRLLDTASFAQNLTDKLYSPKPENSFVMTIAGYGTGKSHLAVCLGKLFSGDSDTSNIIVNNIATADREIAQHIASVNNRQNLVIVLNGMNNFNLDAEILRCAKLSLAHYGISDDILKKLTRSYDNAKKFVENMFSHFTEQFDNAAAKYGINLVGESLKDFLLSRVEADNRAIEIINEVHEQINGYKIEWDRGLSAGDVLLTLQEELCGADKPFNKILLLFDEFGRYIEFTAANPTVAGDAALQQVFEAVQNANGKIVFTGFIQSELDAYLRRIEKTANINRYIERYRAACENLFLSSNFETILANLLKKNNPGFDNVVGSTVERYNSYHNNIHFALSRWDRSSEKKSVWTSSELYKKTILAGCYPLHPITVWLLSSSHKWMQQRSTLAFVAEMFEQIANADITGNRLPYIYPVQIIDSGMYNEMLNAEEKGLVHSQYCVLYQNILLKIGDKLTDNERTTLKAVLITKMGRMSFANEDDAITAIRYCSNLSDDEITLALTSLENNYAVVTYDNNAQTFDLNAEANGLSEFNRTLTKYALGTRVTVDDIDEESKKELRLDEPIETAFGEDNYISSTEWNFVQYLEDITKLTEENLLHKINIVLKNTNGDSPRGIVIYAYCHENTEQEVERLALLCRKYNTQNYPIVILLLNDPEGEILSAVKMKKIFQKFSLADKERFGKYIAESRKKQNRILVKSFNNCVRQRLMITSAGVVQHNDRIAVLCGKKLSSIYTKAIPFPFDGFQNKIKNQANATLVKLCVGLLNGTLTNSQVYSSLTQQEKNRISAVMSTRLSHSWQVFDDNCNLVRPGNITVCEIVENVEQKLDSGEQISVAKLFGEYTQAPYGLNDNSLALLVSYFIAYQKNKYYYKYGKDGEMLSKKHWEDLKGNLKLPEVRKIYIQKNKNADLDIVGDLCRTILSERYVERCVAMKSRLEEAVQQEGESPNNKYLLIQAREHINEAAKLKDEIYGIINENDSCLDRIKQRFDLVTATKILQQIPVLSPNIADSQFTYSDEYVRLVQAQKDKVTELINQHTEKYVSVMKCKITELSQFKTKYLKAAQILSNSGFEELAELIEKRIDNVEKEIMATQRHQSSFEDCQKDLMLSKVTTSFRDCEALRDKLYGWLTFFNEADDLTEEMHSTLAQKINLGITRLEDRLEAGEQKFNEILSSIENAQSIDDLYHIKDRLNTLLRQQPVSDLEKRVLTLKMTVKAAISCIENLPVTRGELQEAVERISNANFGECTDVVNRCVLAHKKGIEHTEHTWLEKFIVPVERNAMALSPASCTRWLEETNGFSAYLTDESDRRYQAARKLVENRLHASRVEGVMSMYNALTTEEQQEFKHLISLS